MEAGEQWATLSYRLLRSDAWRSLSGPAVKVWLELRTRYHGKNNGQLALSMDEAARLLGLSKSTVKRAFDELVIKGFLKLTRKGHWYGRLASTWETTDKGRDNQLATNDWKQWKPSPSEPKKQKSVPRRHISGLDGADEVPRL